MSVEGKVVVITGAGSGIGRALARGFAADDALVAGFDRDEAGLRATAGSCSGRFLPFVGDVTADADVSAMVERVAEGLGPIDVLVNNAGIANQGALIDRPVADWVEVIRVNLVGAALCCHAVLPRMVKRGSGRVINVVSRAAEFARPTLSAYAASKAGLVAFTRALSLEVGPPSTPDLLVNALIPGPTATALHEGGQDPAAVYPHARYLVDLPPGGPHGRVFWESKEYAIFSRFST